MAIQYEHNAITEGTAGGREGGRHSRYDDKLHALSVVTSSPHSVMCHKVHHGIDRIASTRRNYVVYEDNVTLRFPLVEGTSVSL